MTEGSRKETFTKVYIEFSKVFYGYKKWHKWLSDNGWVIWGGCSSNLAISNIQNLSNLEETLNGFANFAVLVLLFTFFDTIYLNRLLFL